MTVLFSLCSWSEACDRCVAVCGWSEACDGFVHAVCAWSEACDCFVHAVCAWSENLWHPRTVTRGDQDGDKGR